jgi:hypothetical protein
MKHIAVDLHCYSYLPLSCPCRLLFVILMECVSLLLLFHVTTAHHHKYIYIYIYIYICENVALMDAHVGTVLFEPSTNMDRAGRRFQSTAGTASAAAANNSTFVVRSRAYKSSPAFKKAWLSDPSTYPLIFIMGVAGMLVLGVGTSCIMNNPDVQINPNKRGSVVRSWGN